MTAAPGDNPVHQALAQIENSDAFRASPRHRALLRHLVERQQAGDLAALKETMLAVVVFGRSAARFDPREDSIVRVESGRLRRRLAAFYRGEGRDATLRITLPVGGYVPVIADNVAAPARPGVTRRARDLVERGEHFLRQPLARETLEQALARFDEALLESPDYAPAHAGRGRAWFNMAVGWHHAPAEAAAAAAASLRRALVLDDTLAGAHALMGALQHQFMRDWTAARRSFERAVEFAPDDAFVHSAYGCHLIWRPLPDEAEQALLRSRRLDPQYVNTRRHLVNLRLMQNRLDDAQAEIDALIDLAPANMTVSGLDALLALCRGDFDGAIQRLEQARALAPDYAGVLVTLAGVHALAGRSTEAAALMAEMQQRFGAAAVSPYVMAIYETRCGRVDAALAKLHHTLDSHDPNGLMIATDLSLAPLHDHPGWPALVRKARTPLPSA